MRVLVQSLVAFIFLVNYSNGFKFQKYRINKHNLSIGHSNLTPKETESLVLNISQPIENDCISFYKNLAQVSSLFIQCVANNSRPFHVCQNCLHYYLQFNEAYTLIKNVIVKKNI